MDLKKSKNLELVSKLGIEWKEAMKGWRLAKKFSTQQKIFHEPHRGPKTMMDKEIPTRLSYLSRVMA